MGFLGILEDKKVSRVPGTVILDEQVAQSSEDTRGLKHGTGRSSHIVLVPQPSDDPNDPLTWSLSKKLIFTTIIGFGGCLYASTFSPLLTAGLFVISEDLQRPIGRITTISGYQLLVAGSTGAFVSACSRKWGKRPVFLASSLCGLVGSIVGSTQNSYGGLVAARVIQGGSTAAYESLIISMLGDIFFVHERGLYMSIMQFILGSVSNFSSVISGAITTNMGWKWLFHFCTLFSGLQTLLLFFFCPETQYVRDKRYNIDIGNASNQEVEKQDTLHVEQSKVEGIQKRTARFGDQPRPKKTSWQELAVFTRTYTDENFLQLLIAPFAVYTNLVILWVVVVTGTVTATFVAQSFVLAQIFAAPPYLLTPTGVGYLSLGPFIGGTLATLVLGTMNDYVIRWCARKNRGVYEPEYRLVPIVIGLTAGAGLMGFGALCQNHSSYYATATMHGLGLFGIIVINIVICSYGLDAYRDLSSEIFVQGIIFKNFLFYGFTYFVNDWTARVGPQKAFNVFGAVVFALVATTPLVFVFGKKYRSFWARYPIMERLHIKSHADI